jgi:hypothetical protein
VALWLRSGAAFCLNPANPSENVLEGIDLMG